VVAAIDVDLSGTIGLGEVLVAVGTLALAFITWRLARTTGQSVHAARDSVEAERATVEAMAMPYIVATPSMPAVIAQTIGGEPAEYPPEIHRGRDLETNQWMLRLHLWNIGTGPAIVTDLRVTASDKEFVRGLPQHLPIGATLANDAEALVSDWPTDQTFASLRIDYLHSSGKRYITKSDVMIEDDTVICYTYERLAAPST
jgi:hypothetical protein